MDTSNAQGELIELLAKRKLTVSLAESATAGYASYLLTKIPGSSKVFRGGLIVYSLSAKHTLLGLSTKLLMKTDGVSGSIAAKLSSGVRKLLKTDIGAAIVGFAGPGCGKETKPGTFFIAVSDKKETVSGKLALSGSRDAVRKQASIRLLELIYKQVTNAK
jgi:PncC family amidohydrolase